MAQDLEQVKEELYKAFNRAMEGVREFSNLGYDPKRVSATAHAVRAASDAANAIVNVERELEERKNGGMGPKLRMKP